VKPEIGAGRASLIFLPGQMDEVPSQCAPQPKQARQSCLAPFRPASPLTRLRSYFFVLFYLNTHLNVEPNLQSTIYNSILSLMA
jgi:hypothetical protein